MATRPLVKLAHLPTLKVGRYGVKQFPIPMPEPTPELNDQDLLPALIYPFSSRWEVYLNEKLLERDYRWVPQVPLFGGAGGPAGGTTPDWVNTGINVAFYLDGPVHSFRPATAQRDIYLRKAVEAAGYRVVVWAPPTLHYLITHLSEWYQSEFGGS